MERWSPNGQVGASMGPRLFRRGNIFVRLMTHSPARLQWGHVFSDVEIFADLREKGIKTKLQWGHVFSDVEICKRVAFKPHQNGFNGATSFQTWKSRTMGRGTRANSSFNGATSFQTWKSLPQHRSSCRLPCFNGATSFQTWKCLKPLSGLCASCQASMGPRLFRRGNKTIS